MQISRPISRVLYWQSQWRPSILDLRYRLPLATYPQVKSGPPNLLLGLAPDGVYLAGQVTLTTGGLLHHLFTLTNAKRGGLFSAALARGSPRVAVSHHPVLWSPDFPRLSLAAAARPTDPGQ